VLKVKLCDGQVFRDTRFSLILIEFRIIENAFFRHWEIYQAGRGFWGERLFEGISPFLILDEFPAGYSLTGCSPALPVSASPVDL
jgi:hypothetical protein